MDGERPIADSEFMPKLRVKDGLISPIELAKDKDDDEYIRWKT